MAIFKEILIKDDHFLNVVLELLGLSSIFQVKLLDTVEFIQLVLGVGDFLGSGHVGDTGVGLVKEGRFLD